MGFSRRTHKHGKGQCDRCGFVFKLKHLRYEHTGLRVCGTCWDPLTAQEYPSPIISETTALDDPRPRNDTYAANGTAMGTYGIIGRDWLGADLGISVGEVTRG